MAAGKEAMSNEKSVNRKKMIFLFYYVMEIT